MNPSPKNLTTSSLQLRALNKAKTNRNLSFPTCSRTGMGSAFLAMLAFFLPTAVDYSGLQRARKRLRLTPRRPTCLRGMGSMQPPMLPKAFSDRTMAFLGLAHRFSVLGREQVSLRCATERRRMRETVRSCRRGRTCRWTKLRARAISSTNLR